jgi:hypothetical protein
VIYSVCPTIFFLALFLIFLCLHDGTLRGVTRAYFIWSGMLLLNIALIFFLSRGIGALFLIAGSILSIIIPGLIILAGCEREKHYEKVNKEFEARRGKPCAL